MMFVALSLGNHRQVRHLALDDLTYHGTLSLAIIIIASRSLTLIKLVVHE